jgi:DHA1 family bicyclomycin/chloramphenicol resistance-like MFS transporter
VFGTLQSALGAAVAPLMGIAGGHTVMPLFLGMTGCALTATLALRLTRQSQTGPGRTTILKFDNP